MRELIPQRRLQILFLEDNPDDLDLALLELKKARLDFCWDVAESSEELAERLRANRYDVIVSDYRLRNWTGMDALHMVQQRGIPTPFILITGSLGEEAAVDCIREGLTDYVLKDRLARLPVAICRSVKEALTEAARNAADEKLRESDMMFETLAEAIDSAIFIYVGARCRYANRHAEIITGFTREELVGMNSLSLVDPTSRDSVIRMGLHRPGEDNLPQHYEVKITTRSGEPKWLDMTSRVIDIKEKRARVLTAFDITERKIVDDEIRRQASMDPLTGLANYRRFLESFESEATRSRRTGRCFSIVFLDLDGLKKINDVHGHPSGSRALCRVAKVLQTQCRAVDVPARYGGDEFGIILPETSTEAARHLARRIEDSIRKDSEEPRISASFGLATFPDDGGTLEELLRIAAAGLYLMKGVEKGTAPKATHNLTLVSR